jgi:outer membrane biosynthesis protein TonB
MQRLPIVLLLASLVPLLPATSCGSGTAASATSPAPAESQATPPPPPPPPPIPPISDPAVLALLDPPSSASAEPPPSLGGAVPEERTAGRGPVGRPDGPGALDHDAIHEVISQQQPRFRHCYVRLLQNKPDTPVVRVTVRFTVGSDGAVSDVAIAGSSVDDPTFVDCIRSLAQSLSFPPSGGSTTVSYPFVFQLAAGS